MQIGDRPCQRLTVAIHRATHLLVLSTSDAKGSKWVALEPETVSKIASPGANSFPLALVTGARRGTARRTDPSVSEIDEEIGRVSSETARAWGGARQSACADHESRSLNSAKKAHSAAVRSRLRHPPGSRSPSARTRRARWLFRKSVTRAVEDTGGDIDVP
jgi:hypothetical protein